MKPTILLCLAALALPLGAEPEELSSLDAQLLLEKLKELREGSDARISSRYEVAHKAFLAAIQSDAAAHEFFLQCVEKVQFEDEKKKAADFRDWKRVHKEREDTPAFRRALRHQLNWLLLTLEAASEPKNRDELWPKVMKRIDLVFDDAEELMGEQGRLRQDVLQSVFATAYGLGSIKINDWVNAPLMIPEAYEMIILPPLRNRDSLAELRKAWDKRILHEGSVHSLWGRPSNARGGRDGRPVELERFLAERRPQLQWEMERDLFRAGDQKGAALRMLAHIEKHVAHKNCADWITDFEGLVRGGGGPSTSAEDKPAAGESGAAKESRAPQKKSEAPQKEGTGTVE